MHRRNAGSHFDHRSNLMVPPALLRRTRPRPEAKAAFFIHLHLAKRNQSDTLPVHGAGRYNWRGSLGRNADAEGLP